MANLGSLVYQLGVDTRDLNRAEGEVLRSAGKMKSEFDGIKSTVAGMFAGLAFGAGVKSLIDTATTMDALNTRMKFSVGSAQEATAAWGFLREQSARLGVDLQTSAEAFTKFASAARGTALAGEPVKKVFLGITEAVSVMGLSNEEASGAMLALTQMLSKGKVQAEELRGQLGERIPGAFQIAARAMNMTTAELDKFMADGKLMAEDFLPKFAAQLSKEMAEGLDDSTKTMRANLNRLSNAWLDFKSTVLTSGFSNVAIQTVRDLIQAIGETGKTVKDNKGELVSFFEALANIGKAVSSITIPALVGVVDALGKISSIYNSMPSELKSGLGLGIFTTLLTKNPQLALTIGLTQSLKDSLDTATSSLESQDMKINRNKVSWDQFGKSVKNIIDVMSGKRDWDTGKFFDEALNNPAKGNVIKMPIPKAGEIAKAWKAELQQALDIADSLMSKRKTSLEDPLGRKAGGNQREDIENRIKGIMEQQSKTQEHINALIDERNNAESEYAAYLADQALAEEEKKQALLQTQYNQEQQSRLQELVATTQDRVKSGKISEKEVQDSITQILRDQEQYNSRINDLTFERERLQRALKASTDLEESKSLVEAISKIDEQLRPAVDHASSLKRALDTMAEARTVAVDADITKFKGKVDELIIKRDEFTKEVRMNINTDEANKKLDDLTSKLRNLLGNNGIITEGMTEGVAQGIYENSQKILSQPLPKGVFVIEAKIAKSPPRPFAEGLQSIIDDFQSIPGTTVVLTIDSYNAFAEVKANLEEVSKTLSINLDDSSAVPILDGLIGKYQELSQPITLRIDTSEAQAKINSIKYQMASINGMSSDYTVMGYWQSSPRVPFSQGYSELLKKLMSIPTESQYTIKSDGITDYMNSVSRDTFGRLNYIVRPQIPGADPEIYKMLINTIDTMKAYLSQQSPFFYGSTSSPMAYYYMDKIPAFEALARISTGKSQDVTIGDITIHVPGVDASGRIDVEGIMAEIERKLRENLKANRSSLRVWG